MEEIQEMIKQKQYDIVQKKLTMIIFNKIIQLINEKKHKIKYTGIFDLQRATKLYLDEKYQYVVRKVYELQNDEILSEDEKVLVLLNLYEKYLNN